MDRNRLSALAHAHHPVAAPLSDASTARLLDRALPRDTGRVLDLGCGAGTWLTRALRARPRLLGEGVDLGTETVAAARERAEAEGLSNRLVFHAQDAREFVSDHRYALVLCVGAVHAFGGLVPALDAARGHLAPGGTVLIGDGFWEREPDRATLGVGFAAEEYADLPTTVGRVTAHGWIPVFGHTSTPDEWDAYEWSWTGSLSEWALDHRGSPDAEQALREAADHRDAWLRGYRGTLGFVTLVLRDARAEGADPGRPTARARP